MLFTSRKLTSDDALNETFEPAKSTIMTVLSEWTWIVPETEALLVQSESIGDIPDLSLT